MNNTAAKVAQRAGVSISTVSRVVNAHPSVSEQTARVVRQAMDDLAFKPSRRTRSPRQTSVAGRDARITFCMFGASNASPAPSFQRLLYGVSKGADTLGVNLRFRYLANDDESSRLLDTPIDGLLLHGLEPDRENAARLKAVPTVWLMGNRTRPTWGDQVMPDNTAIGTLAANYLMQRGHRVLGYLGLRGWSWSFGIRALAFAQTCRDLGGESTELMATATAGSDYWGGDLPRAAGDMVEQLLKLPRRPTALFVSEDRLLPVIQVALAERNLAIADPARAGGQPQAGTIELISCNNDARFLPLRGPVPPSIDIGAETIGRRGIEHLLWRLANSDRGERLRIMVAPTLVEPTPPTTT